jgi:septum formation protein
VSGPYHKSPNAPERIVLASASPRRAQLLQQLAIDFDVVAADVDESVRDREAPEDYVRRMALDKSAAVAATHGERVVLGADTAVVKAGQILGKPVDRDDGIRMLLLLADGWHEVRTAVAVTAAGAAECVVVTTRVWFRAISDAEADAYWRTGEPCDKAGGYGIQGIGSIFASKIEGSYSAVVGLPLAETEGLLKRSGVDTWRSRTHG